MSQSASHHYVPQAILKNFCFEGRRTYYLYRGHSPPIAEPKNIKSIFTCRHYNSFSRWDGSKNDTLETFFARELDNYVPSWLAVFKNSLASGSVDFINEASKRRFIQFFYNHIGRTPDFTEPIVQQVSDSVFDQGTIENLEEKHRILNNSEQQSLTFKDYQSRIAANSRVMSLSTQSEIVLDTLASMTIVVAAPSSPKKQFIVGSNPVVRFEDHPNQHLTETGVELWTTLAPNIAVGFVSSKPPSTVVGLDEVLVRKMNLQLAKNSTRIAGRSQALLESLAKNAW